MPGLGGIELQALLHAEGHHIPVIFVTAHPDKHVRDDAIRAGAVCFLSMPITSVADLILCLDRALKKA
jgi:FixJ family two-component response regulator